MGQTDLHLAPNLVAALLRKNILYLALSQVANYVLPLITIPYLTRTLGPEAYGLSEWGITAYLYLTAVVIFGFHTTGTRTAAQSQGNTTTLSTLFSAIFYTRVFLALAMVLAAIALALTPALESYHMLFWAGLPLLLGWMFYPEFHFQGSQNIAPLAVGNFIVKTIATFFIFLLIKQSADYWIVLAIQGVAQLGVGAALFAWSFKSMPGLRLYFPGFSVLKQTLSEGWPVFLSHFFTRIYTFGSVLFVGWWVTSEELGWFSAGFKLVMVAQSLIFIPLTGALFPYLTTALAKGPSTYQRAFRKTFVLTLAATAVIAAGLMATAPWVIQLLFGTSFAPAVPMVRIMAPLLVLTALHHFALQQGLLIYSQDKTYLKIIVITGMVALMLNLGLTQNAGATGASWARLLSELVPVVAGWLAFQKWKVTQKDAQSPPAT
jgi:PST family polysaccharide transporter